MKTNTIITGDSAEILKSFPDGCIDLTVTSPPYDNLRTYNGFTFDFETIARQLFRVTKAGGVVVWVVGDATVNGSETLTSFRQAIRFQEIGFNVHDTMIYAKSGFRFPFPNRYHQVFEYMFVLSKQEPSTFNPLADRKNMNTKKRNVSMKREADGSKTYRKPFETDDFGKRFNIWNYDIGGGKGDDINHPAMFPEALAADHIESWSNEGDIVLDCFAGSGTTLKMAKMLSRQYIGIEISPEYVTLAEKRLLATNVPLFSIGRGLTKREPDLKLESGKLSGFE